MGPHMMCPHQHLTFPDLHPPHHPFQPPVQFCAPFSLQERQRKYLSLSPWDKATLSMVRCRADPSLPQVWGLGC